MELWDNQKDLIKQVNNSFYVVVKKPRQCGFTTVAVEMAVQEAQSGKNVVFFVNHNTKKYLIEMIKDKVSQMENIYVLVYGDRTVCRADFIIMDEPAFAEPVSVEQSWWSAMTHHSPEARILIGSTPGPATNVDGMPNFFYEIWNRENVFVKVEWSIADSPVMSRRDFSHLSEAHFDNEIRGNFILRALDKQSAFDLDMRDDGNYVLKLRSNARFSITGNGNGSVLQMILTPEQLELLFKQIKDIK